MIKKEFFSSYEKVLKFIKKVLSSLSNSLKKFDKKYPSTSQNIQLSFIYFFAFVDLTYSTLSNVFSLGFTSQLLEPVMFIIRGILQSPILQVLCNTERIFFLSFVTLEFMVIRSTFNFSKFIKYNILLIFALLMVQGVTISLWDVVFHREITGLASNWTLGYGMFIGTDKFLATFFFFSTFVGFSFIYLHFYLNALNGKIVTIPGLEWVTDSVAFWLRIATPTMRFRGKGKKEEDSKK